MITKTIECEECDETVELGKEVSWLRVELQGIDDRVFGDVLASLPWHFCSLECLVTYLTKVLALAKRGR